jgi:hypothetical protein
MRLEEMWRKVIRRLFIHRPLGTSYDFEVGNGE